MRKLSAMSVLLIVSAFLPRLYCQKVVTTIDIDGKYLRITDDVIKKSAEKVVEVAEVRSNLSEGEVKDLAERLRLFERTETNPHLTFKGGDISFWHRQKMREDDLTLEFQARRAILEAADKQGFVIRDQGVLSWAAQQVMGDIQAEKIRLKKASKAKK